MNSSKIFKPFDSIFGIMFLTALIKMLVLWFSTYFIALGAPWINHIFVDIWGWLDFFKKSQEGLVPYVDFTKEYPVGGGLFYWLLAKALPSNDSTLVLHAHAYVMSAIDVLTVGLFYSVLKEINAKRAFGLSLLFALLPTGLVLSPVRFEGVVLLTALGGYWLHLRGRTLWSVAVWSLGCSIKWFPIVFIAAQEWSILWSAPWNAEKWWKKHALKAAGIFFAVMGAVNLPFVIIGLIQNGNIDAWAATYLFHVQRPLYWDTVLGVMQLWRGEFSWERYASLWSAIGMLLVLLWKPRMRIETKSILVILAALIFNRIYSTQFHLWFYPMVLFLIAYETDPKRFRGLLGYLLVLDALNILVYPFTFSQAVSEMGGLGPNLAAQRGGWGTVLFSQFIVIRAVVLVAFFVFLVKLNAASAPSSSSRSAGTPPSRE